MTSNLSLTPPFSLQFLPMIRVNPKIMLRQLCISSFCSLTDLSKNIRVGERDIYRSLQFYDKYPELNELPEGKNITWNKLVTKYLPTKNVNPDGETDCPHRQVEILIRCARCRERLAFRRQGRDSSVDLASILTNRPILGDKK